mgnify:FL=1
MSQNQNSKKLIVRGARAHNLQGVNATLPKNSLVVITGPSGSGKSSLAFDTIYAEGQRRYVESLSAYARQFLELMQKPEVDMIEGLSPAISIEQKTTSRNPRSTVGTVTEIYDYLRLLFARIGIPYSPTTGKPIESQTVSQMVDAILSLPIDTRLLLLAPVIRGRKGEFKRDFSEYRKKGFQRIKIDGEIFDLSDTPALDKNIKHDIEVVVDRLILREGLEARLADSIETVLELSDGLLVAENADTSEQFIFSAKFACPVSGFTIEEIEPRLFSFNNPFGACSDCEGLGTKLYFDKELIIPNAKLSLKQGAVAPWASSPSKYYNQTLNSLCAHFSSSMDTPFENLDMEFQNALLFGSGETPVEMTYDDGSRSYTTYKPFEGLVNNLGRRFRESDSNRLREELSRYQSTANCEACKGQRLKPAALAVRIHGLTITDVTNFPISQAVNWFETLESFLEPKQIEVAERILKEVRERLGFLKNVGLEYLTLSRSSGTLSGGESQRIRLASQIGSGLTGVLYVLDEPSIGLHQRDNERLLKTLQRLRDLGNTVIVVEHDEDAIRNADYVIDMGPGAGKHGGTIVAEGLPEEIIGSSGSLTGKYLSGALEIAVPTTRRSVANDRKLKVIGAKANNLKNITASIPLGTFTCVTGVSGGGKSSLVIETIWKIAARILHSSRLIPGPYDTAEGLEYLDKVVDINQSPIGRTPRSNPATYTGAFTPIREWFSGLPEAKVRGYGPGRFSFNVKGGRCEACQGDGVIKIEMHFLPDVYVQCETCKGKRYNRETLDVKYKGKSIADVLEMTVDDGADFFKAIPSIRDKLVTLQRVGLGYITIGQPATTLSGGEAQRVKLSKELARRATGKTLYILDEPTTGLHFDDIKKLLEVLHTLVNQGNTVVVIEHNLDVIKTADWIIDIGPNGGEMGGSIVTEGTPEDIVRVKESQTGHYLKILLERQHKKVSEANVH